METYAILFGKTSLDMSVKARDYETALCVANSLTKSYPRVEIWQGINRMMGYYNV